MNISIAEELICGLDEIDKRIKYLESSPNRVFVLIESDTLTLFHWFNLCFKQYWDKFNRHSASQLLLYQKIVNKYSELSKRYVSLFREQIDYLKDVLDFDNKSVKDLAPFIFIEDNGTDVIGYYNDCLKYEKDNEERPLYKIDYECNKRTAMIDELGCLSPIGIYQFHSDKLNYGHYKSLLGMNNCLKSIYSLMSVICSYPDEIQSGYKPNQEEILIALENELRQYALEVGKDVERDLRKTAQKLKSSRNTPLTPDVWGLVMEEEDKLFDFAISGKLEENEIISLENISATRKQLTDNYSLLQKIKTTSLDEELFDIRLSVGTHQLLSALNADNLDLFYELVLRRNIIHREMFPKELGTKYEEWVNPSEERQSGKNEGTIPDDANLYNEEKKLNYFAPKIALQKLLMDDWFDKVSVDKQKYNAIWRSTLVEALMKSDYGKDIASDWTDESKRLQVKFAFIGALKDADVIDSSYNALASKFNISNIDTATLAKYMGYGKKKIYYKWLKHYVNPEIIE